MPDAPPPWYRRLAHHVAHWRGLNEGRIVSALDRRGNVWIGFRCTACGQVAGIHMARTDQPPPSAFS